ncbi:glycosyltransferase [Sphingobacterium siyangense]|uniref:glycosyltransferase n=1 Tax=Sphingobacterium siyangense TaxID=459529 RepID=UPI003DA33501
MRIIFLGGIFDSENFESIKRDSKGVIQYAADNLQKSFIKGLKAHFEDISIINLPFIGSYPSLYNKWFAKFKNSEIYNIEVLNIPFVNLKAYKIISRLFKSYKGLKNYKEGVIVMYSINISFIAASCLRKLFSPKLKLVLIVPDLPEFMSPNTSKLKKILLRVQDFFLKSVFYPAIDGFVLLTIGMNDRLDIEEKKIVVIEGIFSDKIYLKEDSTFTQDIFSILYTGTLAKRYGIVDLLEQFHKTPGADLELIICGAGDGINEVNKFVQADSRIKYLGQVDRSQIIELQRNCSLLINPRKPEEFTKYSFPSKTMEYFASGTPVLMYKLEGIPNEYFERCYTILDEEDSISKNIIKIKNETASTRKEKGRMAQDFIKNNKNEIQQVSKLFNLINKIYNNGN